MESEFETNKYFENRSQEFIKDKSSPKTKRVKLLLVTNLCSPYRVGLYELLDKIYNIKFLFFSSGEEKYYDGECFLGDFNGRYLSGFHVFPKIKINPALIWELLFQDYTYLIKCINGPFPLLLSFIISKLRKKKFILWTGIWHHPETLFHRIFFPVVLYLYRTSDAIVVYGTHVKRYLTYIGVPENKIAIAWQVQDNKKFAQFVSPEQIVLKKAELLLLTRYVILFVGRLMEGKGVNILLEAFSFLRNNDVSLLIIGRGKLDNEVKAFVAKSDHIIHISHVPTFELYMYYAIADILVLPSITAKTFKEPWGFVINEAMCQGCAIITSDAVGAGVGGLVENGGNGYVVPENNTKALRVVMEKLLSDELLLYKMQKRSKEIIKDWTYEKMTMGFTEALEIADRHSKYRV